MVYVTFNVISGKLNGYPEELERRQNPMVDVWIETYGVKISYHDFLFLKTKFV